MAKEIEIPEGYEARIEGNKVILEPKESEDERIRWYVTLVVKDWWNKIAEVTDDGKWPTEEEMLAYLEKQKERSPFISAEESLGISQEEYNKIVRECIFDERKEQKPIPKFKVGDRIYDKRDSYNRNVIREVGKDYYINAFAQKMDMAYTDANFEFIEHLDNDLIDSKPAEWSEKDEALLKEIVSFFKDGTIKLQHDLDLYAGFLENKFKSLRPQHITYALDAPLGYDKDMNPIYPPINHWKPTEKQIAALEWQIKNTYEGSWQRKESESLYDDLKKL